MRLYTRPAPPSPRRLAELGMRDVSRTPAISWPVPHPRLRLSEGIPRFVSPPPPPGPQGLHDAAMA
eukprot:3427494-Alexandrium_andersonii.AAC.1